MEALIINHTLFIKYVHFLLPQSFIGFSILMSTTKLAGVKKCCPGRSFLQGVIWWGKVLCIAVTTTATTTSPSPFSSPILHAPPPPSSLFSYSFLIFLLTLFDSALHTSKLSDQKFGSNKQLEFMCIRYFCHRKFQLFTTSVKMSTPALASAPASAPVHFLKHLLGKTL